jgi:hypothetical protein
MIAPGVKAAGKRTDTRNAPLPQTYRHPGARGFVWSRAINDDLAVTRNFRIILQLF